jgi:aspartyl-tRNA(Asn)/glutamyl-tRNA(Gln) amidotransferase subunit B
MQEGSLRCDANVNLHIPHGDGPPVATPIVEVKNLNSFRGVEAAIEFEAKRQQQEFARTGRKLGDPGVTKETRGWNAERGVTFAQRGKEEASDYRYFPDPDLVPVTVSRERTDALRGSLGEFPAARRTRFEQEYGLSSYDSAVVINQGQAFADYFEAVAVGCGDGKQAANWVTQMVLRELNERAVAIGDFPITADVLFGLLGRIVAGELTIKSGRDVFAALLAGCENGIAPTVARVEEIINEQGLARPADTTEMDAAIDAAIGEHAQAVAAIRAGKLQAAGPLIGKVMSHLKGADPKQVRERIIDRARKG